MLDLALGYSHNIIFEIPKELKVATDRKKVQNPKIITGRYRQAIDRPGSAKLRSLRKPEPYKGKGVKFAGEMLRRKAGKAAGK
jgi:large subunit ribosomal protein L6